MGNEKYTYVPFEALWQLEKDSFIGMGVPDEDAKICADVLFEADKRGIDSHGVGRLFMYYARVRRGQQKATTKITVEREKAGTARLAADNGMGQPVSHKAMQMAIDKAKKCGIGMVTVGESNHYGIAGYYSLMASEQGCIGITGTNARPSIAPTWSVEPMLGTNPLTIAFPTDYEPTGGHWFADHATSITQRGKIEWYARLNKPAPKGWVINSSGENPTDTNQILKDMLAKKAALTPLGGSGEELGGYKGYNYATFVEVLSAGLCSANFLQNCLGFHYEGETQVFDPYRLGHFFIAVDIEAFEDLNTFKKTSGEILRSCANAKKQPGADHIYVAGEKEYTTILEREKTGIPLSEATQLQLLEMMDELKMDKSNYPIKWTVEYSGKADAQGW
ncbi:Malate dehydrogenase [Candidatus Lokiarchaeum ossiferum]|uniref:Malate dehydrogenase n=1 Tax=Candidatus Lokiarchaeum ossiferum TaxID=2951803 RepID=A0ABY6HWK7_9ARCH|nr:Malate dehydrogenase [Candidatus Lokiarchaeum sp. B-35]